MLRMVLILYDNFSHRQAICVQLAQMFAQGNPTPKMQSHILARNY